MKTNKDLDTGWGNPFAAFEYVPYFDMRSLRPVPGETVHVYVPERFISFAHPPIADRNLYGWVHYSPDSDIAAMIFHSGILFVDQRSKDSRHRQFCVAKNVFEAMSCSETEYPRRVNIENVPQDLRIQGVLVLLLFCNSPTFFPASNRNGLRSREADKDAFSMRIANFRIISSFDEKPIIVKPEQAVKQRVFMPQFMKSFTNELAFKFSGGLFAQIVSLSNIVNGLFEVYRLFFDCEGKRYEIKLLEEPDIIFTVVQLIDPLSLDTLKRKPSAGAQSSVAVAKCQWNSLRVGTDCLDFDGFIFAPVSSISMISLTGKLSRSPSLRFVDNET